MTWRALAIVLQRTNSQGAPISALSALQQRTASECPRLSQASGDVFTRPLFTRPLFTRPLFT